MSAKNKSNAKGRPPGSGNRDYASVVWYPPRCPKCGCTDTKKNDGHPWHTPCTGIDPTGKPFNYRTTRRVQCAGCDQWRYETTYEMRAIEAEEELVSK